DPELIPVGLLLSLRGHTVIYDAHEHLACSIRSKPWLPVRTRRLVAAVAHQVARLAQARFAGIVAATPHIAAQFVGKCIVVQNFPLNSEIPPISAAYGERSCNVVYAGGISPVRGIFEMVDAVGIVSKRRPIELLLAGAMPDTLLQRLQG